MLLKNKNGFTLLEMVVAVAIFIVIALLVTDIFLIASKSHRRTMEVQKVLSDSRFAMESMVREIRMDEVAYNHISDEELGLIGEDNKLIIFKQEDSDVCPDDESRPCLAVGQDTDGDDIIDQWASITPAGIALVRLHFYISPLDDPFELITEPGPFYYSYAYNLQPRVTIVLATRSVNPPQGETVPEVIYLQTTAVARIYKR